MTAAADLPGVCPDCYEDDCCGDCWCCQDDSDEEFDGYYYDPCDDLDDVVVGRPVVTVQPAEQYL